MTDRDQHREAVAALVDAVAGELARMGLWEDEPPSAERLASEAPFSHDTLDCHQWLQWQFVPRMRRLLAERQPLPRESAILPYVEGFLEPRGADPARLLFLIRSFDELITGHAESTGN